MKAKISTIDYCPCPMLGITTVTFESERKNRRHFTLTLHEEGRSNLIDFPDSDFEIEIKIKETRKPVVVEHKF